MALLWIEGFEGYGASAGTDITTRVARRYQYSNGSAYIYVQTGRTGGLSGNASSDHSLATWHLTTADTLIVGCGLKPSGTQTLSFIQLWHWATLGIDVQWTGSTGEISVYRGTTLLGTTTGAGLVSGTWSYIEIKVKCHNTAGTVEVRVNGVTKLSLTNQDTQQGGDAYHNRLCIYLSDPAFIDDVYCCDNTGSVNNDFLGPRKVLGLFPGGDSATLEWTPSTAGKATSQIGCDNQRWRGPGRWHGGLWHSKANRRDGPGYLSGLDPKQPQRGAIWREGGIRYGTARHPANGRSAFHR